MKIMVRNIVFCDKAKIKFNKTEVIDMLGLKRGTVALYEHSKEWETLAEKTVEDLNYILSGIATDIQHVGSTSIMSIRAKPIIDIAVAVISFSAVLGKRDELQAAGYYYCKNDDIKEQLLFACGSYYDGSGDLQTHFIHVVLADSMEWINYINFRDYMNFFPDKAKEYENLKLSLAAECPVDEGRKHYLCGKHDFIVYTLRKALVWSYLGKTVNVSIDRPIGYVHLKESYTLTYPINYGFISGVLGGDGEELDVYILGVDKPLSSFTGRVIGIAHRDDDVEDKLIAAPQDKMFTEEEIRNQIDFQEQYYKTRIEVFFSDVI